ncbi:MAG: hypothetical protein HYW24_00880 [Candidatus Aenigmarchaeota archaeon]|nr:hypothetical protein [Candidatus Aenigmarchaeota archaeon]
MDKKNLAIVALVVVIVGLVVFLVASGTIQLPGGSKFKTSDEVSGATVDIGSGIEKIGSTLEEIDNTIG